MTSKGLKSDGLLLLAAAIWGFAFVAQRVGMDYVGPFTFNGVRFALGSLSLVPLLMAGRKRSIPSEGDPPYIRTKSLLLLGGLAGIVLFAGSSLQQIGIVYTTAGKAGFITGLYVILVPILGLFWRQRPGAWIWFGALCAATGLYLLSIRGRFSISPGDLLVLWGALFWAGHVLIVGWLSPRLGPVRLAFLQFATCSLLSLLTAAFTEPVALQGIRDAAIPILYGGLLSVGVAYTLQVVAQRIAPPAHAAIILSLEAVFAAFGGWLILSETLSSREFLGCALMLAGILMSQRGKRHTDAL